MSNVPELNVPDRVHLSPETLARLATEPPTTAEAEHLERCVVCAEEIAAMRAQRAALAALPPLAAPDLIWPALARTLRAEGLMRPESPRAGSPREQPVPGAAARGEPERYRQVRILHTVTARAAAVLLLCISSGFVGARVGRARAERAASRAAAPAAPVVPDRAPEAAVPVDSAAVIARLVALETLVVTSDEALRAAPDDPVLRRYRAEAQASRNALLRHVALTVSGTWY